MKPTLPNKQQESFWRKRICNFPDHFSLIIYKGEARAIGLVSKNVAGESDILFLAALWTLVDLFMSCPTV